MIGPRLIPEETDITMICRRLIQRIGYTDMPNDYHQKEGKNNDRIDDDREGEKRQTHDTSSQKPK
jgi:hypothetical protein